MNKRINCNGDSFCDLFAGTGVITDNLLEEFNSIIINDFLYSNEIIYKAYFGKGEFDLEKLENFKTNFQKINCEKIKENYVSNNYGNKFFNNDDAKIIGYIREEIEKLKNSISEKEYSILLASLIYSFDKCSNTVGHYEAFLQNKDIKKKFIFDLISTKSFQNKDIKIFREDANQLVKIISADVVYIDPPYSSRQYSRFYHVLENIVTWNKPELFGVASKPTPENMSEYSRTNAHKHFKELIKDLNCKFIIVSYNNTYFSKSSSSKNKMSLETINNILSNKGKTKKFEKVHPFFNAGKTNFEEVEHKEILFITEVGKFYE